MTLSAAEIDKLKHAPPVEGVLPAILQRWSARAYADRDISSKDLRSVFEAARWAPSSSNEQPWRYIVGLRGTETYKKIIESMVPFNQAWASTAPVVMISAAKGLIGPDNNPNYYALHDLGAASASMAIQAAAIGLNMHQMGGFDHDKARKFLGIPEEFQMGAAIALGYQGELDRLPKEEIAKREIAPRTRKELSHIVFSAWDQPLAL